MLSSSDQDKSIVKVFRAIEAMRTGGMVIMVDDEDRENEGDFVFAAQFVTPEKVNFLAKEARGLICLAMEPALVKRLKLPMMEDNSKAIPFRETAFTVSIEARDGVTTGISAADRCQTIRVAVDDATTPDDLVVPGHVFPLRSRIGGVLERAGHTEGSVDLARLAGIKPAAVICEIMNEDGTMARMPDLLKLAEKFSIPVVSIADLIHYRLLHDSLVEEISKQNIHTPHGMFTATLFQSKVDGVHHLAITKGHSFGDQIVDVRVHAQRPLVDVFGDPEHSGRFRIDYALRFLAECDNGVFVYLLRQPARDDLLHELAELAQKTSLQPRTSPSDAGKVMGLRQYGIGAQILRALGVQRMRTHMSAPRTLTALSGFGLEIVDNNRLDMDNKEGDTWQHPI